jgi:hypothetical protein
MTDFSKTTGAQWMGHKKAQANLKESSAAIAITGWDQFKAELEADFKAAWGQLENWGEEAYQTIKQAIVNQWSQILPAEAALIRNLLNGMKGEIGSLSLEEILTRVLTVGKTEELSFLSGASSHAAQAIIAAILTTL